MATGVGYSNRSLPVFSLKEHNRNPTSVDFPSTDCKRKSDNSTEVKHWKRWPTKKCLTNRRSKYKSNEQSETTTILGNRKFNSLNNLGFFPFSRTRYQSYAPFALLPRGQLLERPGIGPKGKPVE